MPLFDVTFFTEVQVVERITAEDENAAYDLAEKMIMDNVIGEHKLALDWEVDHVEEVQDEEET